MAVLYLRLITPALGLTHADAAVNYPFTFFFWSFALMTLFELWPFRKLVLPWSGFVSGVLAIILAGVSWIVLTYVIEPTDALTIVLYAFFPLCVMTSLASEAVTNLPLPQPWKGLLLTLASVLLGWLVFLALGAAPQAWVYMTPVFLLVFFDGWPTRADLPTGRSHFVRSRGGSYSGLHHENKPPYFTAGGQPCHKEKYCHPAGKLVFWMVVVLIVALAIDFLHGRAGHPVTEAAGSDAESILWVVIMPVYAFDCYQTRRWRQPRKGIILQLTTFMITILLSVLYFGVLRMEEWWISTWAFVIWVFLMIFHWMPMPWPDK